MVEPAGEAKMGGMGEWGDDWKVCHWHLLLATSLRLLLHIVGNSFVFSQSFTLIYGSFLCREWQEKLLQEACRMLADEMNLDPSAPGGMVDFRRTLALSFFFKFYLTVFQKLSQELNGNVSASSILLG